MRSIDLSFMLACYLSCLMPRPKQRPSEWCVENLEFDESSNHGPFRLDGAEYWADVLDDFARPWITDEVLVAGSQSRKTGTVMGGVCWKLKNDPTGLLWVMPNRDLARKFSTQRFSKMIRKSEGTRDLVPGGAKRFDMSALSMMLGASTINLIGSNSAANLSSNPCRTVIMDEVDKFDHGGGGEADAVNLAEQRTKDQTSPQRWKTSTPTLESGLIWQEFLKGDQRRYFVPCPSCSKDMVFAWSKQYTVFPLRGDEAFISWAPDAKVDGQWDYAAVKKTAHVTCPHCQAEIYDHQKKAMVKAGKWVATNPGAPKHFVSRHLPSLYCSSAETSFGSLAVKFIQAAHSVAGVQGFVNGDLAEPYMNQDSSFENGDIVRRTAIELTAEWKQLLTVDAQQKWPYFWFVRRAWNGGNSEGIECGHCEAIDDIRALQLANNISDFGVVIDSGFGSRDDAEIYRNCAKFSKFIPQQNRKMGCAGWLPSKGMPSGKLWPHPKTKVLVPYKMQPIDPFLGTVEAQKFEMKLFEFAAQFYEDKLNLIRDKSRDIGYAWMVSEQMNHYEAEDKSTYWRHLNSHVRVQKEMKGRTRYEYIKKGRTWPDHLLDCEILQIAVSNYYDWWSLGGTYGRKGDT